MIPEMEESILGRWRNLKEDLQNLREHEICTRDTPFRHYVQKDIEEVRRKIREILEEYPFLSSGG